MAVIQTKESNGLLSALGAIGTIGGAAFGVPWLSALGMGANMMNGGTTGGMSSGLENLLMPAAKDLLNKISGWTNPASGSMVDTSKAIKDIANKVMSNSQVNNNWQQAFMLQNQNPYNRGVNNPWELY